MEVLEIIGKRYELLRQLGVGGMGVVYEAADRLTGQTVALKRVLMQSDETIHTTSTSGLDTRIALAREFRTLASLRHPNIISVLDYGFDLEQNPYFTMDLLEKPQTILAAGEGRSQDEKMMLIIQMLQAIAYLHRRGILHCDLKPDNVLVVENQVKVLDFGLSMTQPETNLKGIREDFAGTLSYMAPELVIGQQPSRASDLYAAGMMTYQLFAGEYPYDISDVGFLVNGILNEVPPVDELDLPEEITELLRSTLLKDPQERLSDAAHLVTLYNQQTRRALPFEAAATRESFLQAAEFVGREEQFSHFAEVLNEARAGYGSTWLVGGESGVGKSRLLDEMRTLALVNGVQVLRGQAMNRGGNVYAIWREGIRWLCLQTELSDLDAGVLKVLVPDIGQIIGREVPDPPELDAQFTQSRLFTVIESLFARQEQPLLLILEDLQWCGSESLSLLNRLNRRVRDLPLLIIASYRIEDRPDLPQELPLMQEIHLERLTPQSIEALSASMLGEQTGRNPEILSLLQRTTEGNVFFMVEVVRALAEEAGDLGRIGAMTLPPDVFAGGVQQVIRRRLAQMPEDARPLLHLAAIYGRQLDLPILQALTPGLNLDEWLLAGSNAAVLDVQDGQWRFAHDKLREEILKNISPGEHYGFHKRLAEAIEAVYPDKESTYAQLSYHWQQADNADKEAHYAALAGQWALKQSSYKEALRFFERALLLHKAGRTLPITEPTLYMQLAEAYQSLGNLPVAKARMNQSLTLRGWPMPETKTRLYMSVFSQLLRQVAHRLIRPRPSITPEQRSQYLHAVHSLELLSMINYLSNDTIATLHHTLNALNLAESVGPSPELARAYTTVCVAIGLVPNRRLAELYRQLALSIVEDMDDPVSLAFVISTLGIYDIGIGNWESVEKNIPRAVEIYERVADWQSRGRALGIIGPYHFYRGDFAKALEISCELYQGALNAADQVQQGWGLLGQAEALIYLGRWDEANEKLNDALDALSISKELTSEIRVYGLLALLALYEARYDDAYEYALQAEALIQKTQLTSFGTYMGYAGTAEVFVMLWWLDPAHADLPKKAKAACKAMAKYASTFPIGRPRARLVWGWYYYMIDQHQHAVKVWEKGLKQAEQYQMPFEAAMLHTSIGYVLDSSQHKNAGLELHEQIGSRQSKLPLVNAIERELEKEPLT